MLQKLGDKCGVCIVKISVGEIISSSAAALLRLLFGGSSSFAQSFPRIGYCQIHKCINRMTEMVVSLAYRRLGHESLFHSIWCQFVCCRRRLECVIYVFLRSEPSLVQYPAFLPLSLVSSDFWDSFGHSTPPFHIETRQNVLWMRNSYHIMLTLHCLMSLPLLMLLLLPSSTAPSPFR